MHPGEVDALKRKALSSSFALALIVQTDDAGNPPDDGELMATSKMPVQSNELG
jgi:hypothetical protein